MPKKQQFDEVLHCPVDIQTIKEWVLERQSGVKAVSAYALAQELGFSELHRELKVIGDIADGLFESYDEGIRAGLKRSGVRSRLLPKLVAVVFGVDLRERMNRLISLTDLEAVLRGLSAPVENVAHVLGESRSSYDDHSNSILIAANALFDALELMDRERELILLRVICIVHLGFRWSKEVGLNESELIIQLSRRFHDYLNVSGCQRSLERLKNKVSKVVSRILPDEEPISVLMADFEQWWISLFKTIDSRGEILLDEIAEVLRDVPGDPFRLVGHSSEVDGSVREMAEMEKPSENAELIEVEPYEDKLTTESEIGTIGIDEPVDHESADALLRQQESSEIQAKRLHDDISRAIECLIPLEYDHYVRLSFDQLKHFEIEFEIFERKASGVRALLDKSINTKSSERETKKG